LNKNEIIKQLKGCLPHGQILTDERMSAHTTFRIGGAADIFIEVNSKEELKNVLEILKGEFFLLGNGSNLLVSDKGLRGVVIHLSKGFNNIEIKENTLICGAASSLAAIARTAYDNSLTDFEFAAGIPGSLGGAIVMNAGAYGYEMCNVVRSVTLMTYNGEIVTRTNDEMHFSYRHSLLKEENFIVLEAKIELSKGDKEIIKAKMEDLAAKRRDKQPLEYPSAGSTFKRPEGYFAAKLIDEAGLRGYRIGGAMVSKKHCGFVINAGNASGEDVFLLIKYVQEKVKEKFNVVIEPEVILVGEF
jgi:UDP-N-acetylmuramate dehydrogenase